MEIQRTEIRLKRKAHSSKVLKENVAKKKKIQFSVVSFKEMLKESASAVAGELTLSPNTYDINLLLMVFLLQLVKNFLMPLTVSQRIRSMILWKRFVKLTAILSLYLVRLRQD